ncbi:unnamed protein product [Closterium sp. Naga37s-1]|nr:unnamed protein product [Closterium sp. Naga37s-1]
MPHATLSHVLGPLPPPSALGAAQSGSQQGEFQAQESPPLFPADADDYDAASDEPIVLQHRPSWLNSPLYTFATLNSEVPQPISQEQLQQQREKQAGTFNPSSSQPLPAAHPSRTLQVEFFLSSSLPPMDASISTLADVDDSSQLHTSIQRCYSLLQPSTAVQELIANENLTRVQHSTAVYVEPVSLYPLNPLCTSCHPHHTVNCTTRRLMWFFLGQPEGDATVAGFWPSQALAVAHTFHPSRQPHLLRATLRRSALCRPNPAWGDALPPPIPPAEPTLKEIAEREALRRSSGWFGWWVGRGREGGGRGGSDGSGRSGGSAESEGMEQGERGVGAWVECAQLEAAELFTLASAQGLIHLQHSPQADLIRAQASARGRSPCMRDVLVAPETVPRGVAPVPVAVGGDNEGEGAAEGSGEGRASGGVFEEERGLCHAPFIVPIHKHRMGRQLNVDDTVGLVYCELQKVGSTSWKFWIRQQHHHPHPNQFPEAQLPATSNITEVWYSLSEPDAIRAITRTDYTRFVFVRQPFTRIVSAYLNKHVTGGGPKDYGRRFWARRFFGQLWMLRARDRLRYRGNEGDIFAGGAAGEEEGAVAQSAEAAEGGGWRKRSSSWWGVWKDKIEMEMGRLLSFEEFVRLLGDAWDEDRRWFLDEHIAPQEAGIDVPYPNPLLCAPPPSSPPHRLLPSHTPSPLPHQKPLPNAPPPSVPLLPSLTPPPATHRTSCNILCGLDRIRYDYVGRFESMDADVKALMHRFGRDPGDAFDFGKKIHPTKSRDQLPNLFKNKETYDIVRRVYGMDMHAPLNNISYAPPEELRRIFEEGAGR